MVLFSIMVHLGSFPSLKTRHLSREVEQPNAVGDHNAHAHEHRQQQQRDDERVVQPIHVTHLLVSDRQQKLGLVDGQSGSRPDCPAETGADEAREKRGPPVMFEEPPWGRRDQTTAGSQQRLGRP